MTNEIEFGPGCARKAIQRTDYVVLATENHDDYARLSPVALSLLADPSASVAIGLGFGVLPRLICRHHKVVAFEIEPEIAQRFAEACPWADVDVVVGDFATTIEKAGRKYDVIVYDLGGPVPTDRLTPFLKAGGRIVDPCGG